MNGAPELRNGGYARFVDRERGLVSRRIFSDPDIYRAERERIFARCWLYLAHESQIPNPGDFLLVNMAEESVIVARDRERRINAFINTCRHRGNRVCRADAGNAASFTCSYHGWSYDVRGHLTGLPGAKEFYGGKIDQAQWGLPALAQVAAYNGLVFGTFDPEAPPLETYLGDMRWGLDLLLDQGDLVAVPGTARWTMEANWKFAADNAIGDMYHAFWTHRSAVLVGHGGSNGSGGYANLNPRRRPGFTLVTDYGHGLNANLVEPEHFDYDAPAARWRKNPVAQQRLGAFRSRVNRSNMNVFPNLFVNSGSRELMLRNPLGPTRIEIWKTVLVDRNADPAAAREEVRRSNRHFGPAGMFEQDDGENWDQSTAAAQSNVSQRYDLNYAMGLDQDEFVSDGQGPPRIDSLTNEHAQLWMYECWAAYLDAATWGEYDARHALRRART
jgi:phenylpropionate dioxygenase-like ring-hydroxylating dioxygenase large terminal subunit